MAGHSVRNKDSIGALTKFSSTEVKLGASAITVGGLQYDTSTLSCLTNVAGAGGLDTGSIAANSTYYVYAVLDAGDVVLVCSLSNSAPSGFSSSVLVGGFFTIAAGAISSVGKIENGILKSTVVYHKPCFIKDIKPNGTNGGTSIAQTIFNRDLNTLSGNTDGISLNNNIVTVSKGTWLIEGFAPCRGTDNSRLFWTKTPNGTPDYVVKGMSIRAENNSFHNDNVATLSGEFTVTGDTEFSLQMFTTANNGNGGISLGSGTPSDGQSEVYSTVKLTRVEE